MWIALAAPVMLMVVLFGLQRFEQHVLTTPSRDISPERQ
jgi:hypothetical protein